MLLVMGSGGGGWGWMGEREDISLIHPSSTHPSTPLQHHMNMKERKKEDPLCNEAGNYVTATRRRARRRPPPPHRHRHRHRQQQAPGASRFRRRAMGAA